MATATVATVKDSVHTFLRKNRKYVDGTALEAEFGPSALRRLRELRSEGANVETRKENGVFQYRIK